ncbi:hypothetical protein [Bacillus pseudomycoides]|uniref:hypothetical protein n=1 Tax=Bacillus pseudomycoides TaxID=64104 RepID=UPI000BF0947D|nr:hypothetical protein [Bacillus pseudomycoides]PEJ31586.1 hypothetical protein CN677_18810 [Bacillus pseudomycoides]PGE94032.1 hypothetical protein COM62_26040 [Bacillus pseudomycoides]PHA75627.1 hypothetical protein COE78_29720 [Bacillus pseudomycoides]PHC65669.1 hypothetical protein COF38_29000 [Bacillus pseudomycoides]PHE27226.1 hypothetical protein COF51_29490 [Bacillus pseudomycoides]
MSLNNGRNCNHTAISCSVPGSVSVPENASNITIMELRVPTEAVAGQRARVQLDATIGTEIFAVPGDEVTFSVDAITYQLFRNDVPLTDILVSGNYRTNTGDETLYTFNFTFSWVDLSGDTVFPPDPIHYRIVANVGDYFHVARAQVRNREFVGVVHPVDPILPSDSI